MVLKRPADDEDRSRHFEQCVNSVFIFFGLLLNEATSDLLNCTSE